MSGKDGFGIALLRSDMESSPTFTELAGITNFNNEASRDVHDVTAHDSPNKSREKLGGLIDWGSLDIDVNYDPEVHDIWVDDLEDVDPRDYQIEFPDGTVREMTAILSSFSWDGPFDDKMTGSASFDITGKPTITPVGSS